MEMTAGSCFIVFYTLTWNMALLPQDSVKGGAWIQRELLQRRGHSRRHACSDRLYQSGRCQSWMWGRSASEERGPFFARICQVTYHHVNTEAWVNGYTVDFANLQINYPTTAPKDLASLGYEGLTSMYFSSAQPLVLVCLPLKSMSDIGFDPGVAYVPFMRDGTACR